MNHFFLLFHLHDSEFAEHLQRHLEVLVRKGLLKLYNPIQIEIGHDAIDTINNYHDLATHYLLLVSSHSIADESIINKALHAQTNGKEVWLIQVSECLWRFSEIGSCTNILKNPIQKYKRHDDAYCQIAKLILSKLDSNYSYLIENDDYKPPIANTIVGSQQFVNKIYNIQHIDKADFS